MDGVRQRSKTVKYEAFGQSLGLYLRREVRRKSSQMGITHLQNQVHHQSLERGRAQGTLWRQRARKAGLQNGITDRQHGDRRQGEETELPQRKSARSPRN